MGTPHARLAVLVLLLAASLSGCHSLSSKGRLGKEKEVEYKTPSKMVSIWTNSVLNNSGTAPVRGLGGRIYFYDAEHRPIQVQGGFTAFVYDDSDPDAKDRQEATAKVSFTAEQVAQNFTPSEFGPSYSFWVPWDEVGGVRKQLSVIPVFTDTQGRMLVGDQARHVLPGRDPEKVRGMELAGDKANRVKTADYDYRSDGAGVAQTSGIDDGASRLPLRPNFVASNIELPPSMQQRLRLEPPVRSSSLATRPNRKTLNAPNRNSSESPDGTPSTMDRRTTKSSATQPRELTPSSFVTPTSEPSLPVAGVEATTGENLPPSAHSPLDQLPAQASLSALPSHAPAAKPRGLAALPFFR